MLLLSLAATSIIGTVIPQNESPEAYFRIYGDFLYRLFDVLNVFDMYHSWWFQLLVGMLVINILVCSVDRLSATSKIIFARGPSLKVERYRRGAVREDLEDPRPPADLRTLSETVVSRGFGRVRVVDGDGGFRVFGEKWRWTRLGVYIVHLSVVLMLVGGLIGSFFGFDGYVNIPEGESVDEIRLRNTGRPMRLDFAIRCDDFDVSFYENNAPREFRSSLSLIRDGRVVARKDIIVNDPLRYQGINLFQSSYGELPPEMRAAEVSLPEKISLTLASTATGRTYRETAAVGRVLELPEGEGELVIEAYRPVARFRGQNIGGALAGTLTKAGAEPVEILLPVHFPNFDRMRQGGLFIRIGEETLTKLVAGVAGESEKRYYTGLQVTKDPGVWVVYSGFVLMILGCFVTFFMSHQQVCIEVLPRAGGSRVMVAGLASRNRVSMGNKLKTIAKEFSAGGGKPVFPDEDKK